MTLREAWSMVRNMAYEFDVQGNLVTELAQDDSITRNEACDIQETALDMVDTFLMGMRLPADQKQLP